MALAIDVLWRLILIKLIGALQQKDADYKQKWKSCHSHYELRLNSLTSLVGKSILFFPIGNHSLLSTPFGQPTKCSPQKNRLDSN